MWCLQEQWSSFSSACCTLISRSLSVSDKIVGKPADTVVAKESPGDGRGMVRFQGAPEAERGSGHRPFAAATDTSATMIAQRTPAATWIELKRSGGVHSSVSVPSCATLTLHPLANTASKTCILPAWEPNCCCGPPHPSWLFVNRLISRGLPQPATHKVPSRFPFSNGQTVNLRPRGVENNVYASGATGVTV
jgi:hypothetical protein